ncbi:MAG: AMP-binding protein [Acidimicrobiales bacterium]
MSDPSPDVAPVVPEAAGLETASELTLHDVLAEHARSRPAQIASVCGPHSSTWSSLHERVLRLARVLADAGAAPGERVLWLGQNCHRLLETLLACGHLGAVFCPVNWRQSAEELAFVLADADPSVVVWQKSEIGTAVLVAAQRQSGNRATWIRHDRAGEGEAVEDAAEAPGAPGGSGPDFEELVAAASPWPLDRAAPESAAAVLMIYTGAFGGRPNGALLSHRAILAQSMVIALVRGYRADAVFLNSGPLFHLGTLMSTFAVFHLGGTNVFIRRVEAEAICRTIEVEGCTDAFLMPPTVAEITSLNADGRYDLTSLRVASGSPEWMAMVSADTSDWAARPGGTGQTEVTGLVTFTAFGGTGAHGRPSPLAQVRIHDDDDVELGSGQVGEIVVRGPVVMNGFHNRPELNAAKRRNGWHHTGDLGRREQDGSITFIGPKARMIKSAAENIYPAEVEACLRSHAAVREAAVIGVPDERWAQSVKAIVVLHADHDVGETEIIEHCRAHIASYKKPRLVEFVGELPKNGYQIDYDALDAAFGGGGYPGGTYRSV